jgi:flagellar hook-basal body complex protein FliE
MASPLNAAGLFSAALNQTSPLSSAASAPSTSTAKVSGNSSGELPFADLVKGLIQDTSQKQEAVNENVKQVVSGETDSINDVVLTASRADLAFRLVMEIRNRLISSYQEIMRMQV